MAKYDLLINATAVPSPVTGLPQFQSVKPDGANNPNMPSQQQTFELEVVGVGTVSATAQIVVSNDTGPDPTQFNWIKYGDTIMASGTNSGSVGMGGTQSWRHFGAYLTAISGTNASATCRMSA